MRQLIVTVGPTLLKNASILREIHTDTNVYRINGAHGSPDDLLQLLSRIRREIPGAAVMLDLPGNKIRCRLKTNAVVVRAGATLEMGPDEFNYPEFHRHLSVGDVVTASDNTLQFVVAEIKGDRVVFRSESDGVLLTNKGFNLPGIATKLPFLFQRDLDLIAFAAENKITLIALSFVRTMADVEHARSIIPPEIRIIPKIETLSAVQHLHDILPNVETVLVDRGDLATDVGLEKLPYYQKFIVEKAHLHGCKVILATQFLISMETRPIPTIAEVIDLYNTLKMGVHGIQLSDETAIGRYPTQCLNTIRRIHEAIISEGAEPGRGGGGDKPAIATRARGY